MIPSVDTSIGPVFQVEDKKEEKKKKERHATFRAQSITFRLFTEECDRQSIAAAK